jgi:hypothetical protein
VHVVQAGGADGHRHDYYDLSFLASLNEEDKVRVVSAISSVSLRVPTFLFLYLWYTILAPFPLLRSC